MHPYQQCCAVCALSRHTSNFLPLVKIAFFTGQGAAALIIIKNFYREKIKNLPQIEIVRAKKISDVTIF